MDDWGLKWVHVKFIPGGVCLLIANDNHDIPFLSVRLSKKDEKLVGLSIADTRVE